MRVADIDVPKLVLNPATEGLEAVYHNSVRRLHQIEVPYLIQFTTENPNAVENLSVNNISHKICDSFSKLLIGEYFLNADLFSPPPPAYDFVDDGVEQAASSSYAQGGVPNEIGQITLYNPKVVIPITTRLPASMNAHESNLYESLKSHAIPSGFSFTYSPPPSISSHSYQFQWQKVGVAKSLGLREMSGKCIYMGATPPVTIAKLYVYDLEALFVPGLETKRPNEIVLYEDVIRRLDVDQDRKGFESCLLLSVLLIATGHERARADASVEALRKKELKDARQKEERAARTKLKEAAKLAKAEAAALEHARREQARLDLEEVRERQKAEEESLKLARMLEMEDRMSEISSNSSRSPSEIGGQSSFNFESLLQFSGKKDKDQKRIERLLKEDAKNAMKQEKEDLKLAKKLSKETDPSAKLDKKVQIMLQEEEKRLRIEQKRLYEADLKLAKQLEKEERAADRELERLAKANRVRVV